MQPQLPSEPVRAPCTSSAHWADITTHTPACNKRGLHATSDVPGVAILHAAAAVSNASQGSLVPDQAARLEQCCGVCVGLLGDDGNHHNPRGGGPVGVLLLHCCWLLLGLHKHLSTSADVRRDERLNCISKIAEVWSRLESHSSARPLVCDTM